MVKSRYCPETVETALTAIRHTGSDRAGWESAGIGKATFYDWCRKHPDFLAGVTRAKVAFRDICPEVLRLKAMENLRDYLVNGATITTTSREIIKAPDGTVLRIVEKVSKTTHPMPHWVCDRVLGKKLEVLEAMQVLLAEEVATPAQVDIVRVGLNSLTEQLRTSG